MTMAVCFQCGKIKFGAFVPCPSCTQAPLTEDDLAMSLAMTDHYFDMPTLEQMGAAIRDGNPPRLDPESHAQLIQQIRTSGLLDKLQAMLRDCAPTDEPPSIEGPPSEESR
jgi:hypothetical protein